MSNGFPRSARILDGAGFEACFAARQRLSGSYLLLNWRSNPAGPRLGLAISRKVDPLAVGRNRIKRLLRTEFRLHRARLAACDLVVSARPAARDADNTALREEFHRLLRRLPAALPPSGAQGTMPPVSPPPACATVTPRA